MSMSNKTKQKITFFIRLTYELYSDFLGVFKEGVNSNKFKVFFGVFRGPYAFKI